VLLFGEVEIANAVGEPAPTLNVAASGNINVRGGPGTSFAVISSLQAGDAVTADGRTEDSAWLRVQLDDGGPGWVFAELVTAEGDANALSVRAADDTTPAFRPMQAFYFRSGIGSAPRQAVDSGMLIQTPKGAGESRCP
jgi:N-acetylmuramoyl-L-alanine amidase